LEAKVLEANAVYFGTLGQRGEVSRVMIQRLLDTAKSSGILRVLDVNLRQPFFDAALIRESIERCSILKLSDDELLEVASACGISGENDSEGILRALLDRYQLDLVAMTRGPKGALIVSSSETIDQAGIPVEVADTVGAGDAFTASLVTGILRGEELALIVREACENAALVCSQNGAVPTLSNSSRSIQL
jgi:fructokinase